MPGALVLLEVCHRVILSSFRGPAAEELAADRRHHNLIPLKAQVVERIDLRRLRLALRPFHRLIQLLEWNGCRCTIAAALAACGLRLHASASTPKPMHRLPETTYP